MQHSARLDSTIECHLLTAVDGGVPRVLHLSSAPAFIHTSEDGLDLEFIYRFVSEDDGVALYLFDSLA